MSAFEKRLESTTSVEMIPFKHGDTVKVTYWDLPTYQQEGTVVGFNNTGLVKVEMSSNDGISEYYRSEWLELVKTGNGDEIITLDLPVDVADFIDEIAALSHRTVDDVVNVVLATEMLKLKRSGVLETSTAQPQTLSSTEEKMNNHLKVIKQYARYDGVVEKVKTPIIVHKKQYNVGDTRVVSKGIPMGVFLASYDAANDRVVIGWSLCHSRKDRFDKNTGTGIAFERMRSGRQCHFKDVPHTIRQQLREFAVRATKYYQTVNCVVCA